MTIQKFFVEATRKAAADLEAALNTLPAEKRNASIGGQARSAMNMIAECAIMNEGTAELLVTKKMRDFDFAQFLQTVANLASDEAAAIARLHSGTEALVMTLANVPDADLGVEVAMPWGPMTVAQIVAYPYWNMSYHLGQINLIAAAITHETPANV